MDSSSAPKIRLASRGIKKDRTQKKPDRIPLNSSTALVLRATREKNSRDGTHHWKEKEFRGEGKARSPRSGMIYCARCAWRWEEIAQVVCRGGTCRARTQCHDGGTNEIVVKEISPSVPVVQEEWRFVRVVPSPKDHARSWSATAQGQNSRREISRPRWNMKSGDWGASLTEPYTRNIAPAGLFPSAPGRKNHKTQWEKNASRAGPKSKGLDRAAEAAHKVDDGPGNLDASGSGLDDAFGEDRHNENIFKEP
ncbi:hypothetical protein IW261DRAFT_1421158 [Armillaria novae-zelandiae]|uniref:Uncharacterized protein n=1 Tax=Armillaria novae-zelandiae TaxID=153914 RepID=A0AA39P4L2_9AGAR|nr:hypothetical protein IW261DRAFT_1421158 [Armillaria novae-zelandiae]